MRILRNPTLQFLIVLLLSPLFAIAGESVSGASSRLDTSLLGWFITLTLITIFGIRSVHYQRLEIVQIAKKSGLRWWQVNFFRTRLLAGIGTVSLFAFIAALVILVMLLF